MEKIIIVDDEPGILGVITEVLTDAGFDVTGYNSPIEAIKAIDEGDFDILITDIKMPEMDGIQLTGKIRENHPDLEIIVITGYGSLESVLEAMRQDVYDYILKPFNISDILLTVQKAVENIRLKRQNVDLNRKIEKALSDLTILNEVSKIINSSTEIDEVLNFAISTIESGIEIDMFTIMLADEKNEEFYVKTAVGFSDEYIEDFKIKLGEGIIGQALQKTETVNIAGYENDESFKESATEADLSKTNSFVVIPLNAQEQLLGMITLHKIDSESTDEFDKIKLLEVMSVNLAPMLQLGQYQREREMMLQDSLYGAKNELYKVVRKARDYKGTLSVLIFKLYLKKRENPDIRIFDIGDIVYKHIRENISPIDSSVKIGLDSFLVILQGKTKMLTEELAGKIKGIAESDEAVQEAGFLLDYGYADFPMDGLSFEVLASKSQASLWKFVKS